jgi:hypothetical protein
MRCQGAASEDEHGVRIRCPNDAMANSINIIDLKRGPVKAFLCKDRKYIWRLNPRDLADSLRFYLG